MNSEFTEVVSESETFKSLKAKQDVPAGAFLGDFWGKVSVTADAHTVQIDTDKHVSPAGFTRYTNHACDPNAKFVFQARDGIPVEEGNELSWHMVAARDIPKGEDVTFDYNLTEYAMAAPFDCRCGASTCLKRVQGFKYLADEQKKQRLPHVSPVVRRIVDNC